MSSHSVSGEAHGRDEVLYCQGQGREELLHPPEVPFAPLVAQAHQGHHMHVGRQAAPKGGFQLSDDLLREWVVDSSSKERADVHDA
eukprot:279758-Alexandrium_andersonii.AAC.1